MKMCVYETRLDMYTAHMNVTAYTKPPCSNVVYDYTFPSNAVILRVISHGVETKSK